MTTTFSTLASSAMATTGIAATNSVASDTPDKQDAHADITSAMHLRTKRTGPLMDQENHV
jgi:hypothetical protein